MSTNCLKQPINATVNNNLIPEFGSFIITPKEIENQYYKLVIKASTNITVKAKGSSYLADSIAELTTNPKTEVSGNNFTCYLPGEDGVFEITNKYNITEFTFEPCTSAGARPSSSAINYVKVIDIAELKYSPLTRLDILAIGYGNLAEIKDISTIDNLYLAQCKKLTNVKIENLPISNATQIYIQNSEIGSEDEKPNIHLMGVAKRASVMTVNPNITGQLESLVAAFIENEKYVNSVIFGTGGSTSTIKFGTYNLGNVEGNLTWDSINKITFITISGNKVYAKGATAEEIAEWEQGGKTVYVVE